MSVSSKTRGTSATGLSTVFRAPRALSRASSSSSPRFGRENLPAPLGRVFDVSTPFSSLFFTPARGRGRTEEERGEDVENASRRTHRNETKQNARGFVRRTNERANETGEKRTNERRNETTRKEKKKSECERGGGGYIHILKTNKVGRTRCVIAPFLFSVSFFVFCIFL